MNEPENEALLKVAKAITDGQAIDWEAERAARQLPEKELRRLRLVEVVAEAHRAAIPAGAEPESSSEIALDTTTTLPGPAADPSSLPSPARWGPLEILELLGRGGFGEVYRAFEPDLRREVALKLRRADLQPGVPRSRRFLEEAQRLARVRHPNVVVVHGAAEHDGRRGLWTDLIRGKTLEQVVAEQGPFGPGEAAAIGVSLCGAVAAVHAVGLVHRDIKTSNVMRETGGRIVLMDFGSAAEQPGEIEPRDAGGLSGTPLFMAPEVLRGETPGPVSDIYSLGVVLYRLVSGRFPVEAASYPDLLEKHRSGAVTPLRDVRPDLPGGFVQVVERALDPEPARRFPSAGAMEKALGSFSGSEAMPHPAPAPSPWRRWSLVAAAAVVAIGAGWILFDKIRPGPLKVKAALFRLEENTETRLLPGARVRPGDGLVLDIEGPEKMFVYVVSEDEEGSAFFLFPEGLDLRNPLSPEARHRLPGRDGDGNQMAWVVSSAGGKEDFLVVASRNPLPELERDLARLPKAATGGPVANLPVSPESRRLLRGIGRLEVAGPPPAEASRVAGIARRLAGSEKKSGVWTWRIQLENPPD